MPHIFGKNWKLYYNATPLVTFTNAAVAAASWTNDGAVQDLNMTRDRATTEYKTRDGTYEATGALKRNITFTIAEDTANGLYSALKTAIGSDAKIAISEVDAAIATTGTKGLAGNWKVANMSEAHPVEGVSTVSVTLTEVNGEVIEYVAP